MRMERAIVHSDINHCYAQIEEMLNPELKQRPMAVGGSQEERHGIILAKNLHAKKYKIQTGETLDEARIKCPQLLILPPDYRRYQRITDQVKAIYREYTDRVEEYGLDEAWLDLTQSQRLFGPASQIARTIQQRVYAELGLSISIGLSFNKIFAKMASDFVKPSGFVTITRANFQEKIYPLSVRELFYVGAATQKKLEAWGITTIGDLASRDRQFMRRYFGKVGEMLHWFALGEDISEVALASEAIPVKSVGNSVTAVHDLHTHGEARLVLRVLAESVASRLRDQGLKGKGIALSLRDIHLFRWSQQRKRARPTQLAEEILEDAEILLRQAWQNALPLRSIGISVFDLCLDQTGEQLDLFVDEQHRQSLLQLEKTVDGIRRRFGFEKIQRCSLLLDKPLTSFNPKQDQTIHPIGFLKEPIQAGGR